MATKKHAIQPYLQRTVIVMKNQKIDRVNKAAVVPQV